MDRTRTRANANLGTEWRDRKRVLESDLQRFELDNGPLPGIRNPAARDAFLLQVIDSIKKVQYFVALGSTLLGKQNVERTNPHNSQMFDPLKAASYFRSEGEIDEACWMVFWFIHFGKHPTTGWRYLREVYGSLGGQEIWNWQRISANPSAFSDWLRENRTALRYEDDPNVGFGNHRKYETKKLDSRDGTGAVVQSYVEWISPPRTHSGLFREALQASEYNSETAFQILYASMSSVRRFGRLAKFEYLATIGNLGIAEIAPGKAFVAGSTGPLLGGKRLLRDGKRQYLSAEDVETLYEELDRYLGVGMQVLEDAICNWNKNPLEYVRFSS